MIQFWRLHVCWELSRRISRRVVEAKLKIQDTNGNMEIDTFLNFLGINDLQAEKNNG